MHNIWLESTTWIKSVFSCLSDVILFRKFQEPQLIVERLAHFTILSEPSFLTRVGLQIWLKMWNFKLCSNIYCNPCGWKSWNPESLLLMRFYEIFVVVVLLWWLFCFLLDHPESDLRVTNSLGVVWICLSKSWDRWIKPNASLGVQEEDVSLGFGTDLW